ncbi:hypothetical protein [Cellulosimicrobium sp. TH-20]|uniref:hypothetical protein n=1 Tax=Cellulosimicrobium sp. TH-20 TaxID=1980001 RepID=UPI001C9A24E9
MDWLFDRRTGCWSVQTTMSVGDYIDLVEAAHQSQGAIAGQRDVLTTTTAKRIRNRMVADLKLGAVIPPIVIGALIDEETASGFPAHSAASISSLLPPKTRETFAIIDGMQRTAALIEAAQEDSGVLDDRIRVEFWLTTSVRAMVYRMLVLNTGQVPWTISRQLSVVYAPLLEEIVRNVPEIDKISSPDHPGRRVGGAQYSSDALIELYIAFSLRKTAVDTKEAVSDEFSRLDFVENLSNVEFQNQFYGAMAMLAELDKEFSRYDGHVPGRFGKGRAVFDGQPSRIGLIVSLGLSILGRPGAPKTSEERVANLERAETDHRRLIERLREMDTDELGDFLRLDVLQEVLDRRVGQVGRYERSVYFEAFKVLVEEGFNVENMEPCWRAN